MKILNLFKLIVLMAVPMCCTQVFADTVAHTAVDNSDQAQINANIDATTANTAAAEANTAKQNADTAAENANTAAMNAATAAKMLTPVPAPKETTPPPSGYSNCFAVKDAWVNGEWVPEHRVCQYNQSSEGVVWVEGYWACIKYKTSGAMNGQCINWQWKAGRWAKTFDVY